MLPFIHAKLPAVLIEDNGAWRSTLESSCSHLFRPSSSYLQLTKKKKYFHTPTAVWWTHSSVWGPMLLGQPDDQFRTTPTSPWASQATGHLWNRMDSSSHHRCFTTWEMIRGWCAAVLAPWQWQGTSSQRWAACQLIGGGGGGDGRQWQCFYWWALCAWWQQQQLSSPGAMRAYQLLIRDTSAGDQKEPIMGATSNPSRY